MTNEYVKIAIAGDFECFKKQNDAIIKQSGGKNFDSYYDSMKSTKGIFADADNVLANMETPVCDAP